MNELNQTHDQLFRQILIGEGNQYGIKKQSAEKFLKKNGDYTIEDFVKTVNERYRGKYIIVENEDRLIILAVNPKIMEESNIKILRERNLAILCVIFIHQAKVGLLIREPDIYKKFANNLSENQIKAALNELKKEGYIEYASTQKSDELNLKVSQMGLHMIPLTMFEDAMKELFQNVDMAQKLKEILPMDYLKIQIPIQKTLEHLTQKTRSDIE